MKTRKIFLGLLMAVLVVSASGCGLFSSEKKKDGPITIGIGYTTAANPDDPYHVTALAFKNYGFVVK